MNSLGPIRITFSCWLFYNKEIKNAPSALLSYISTREFLRTREKCREARAVGECLAALLECF